jgi:hypothetical protein
MDLSAAAERRRLVSFLRSRVPGIWNVDDDSVLRLVGGYPRVIGRWLDDDAHDAARTLDGFRRMVQESLEFRYSDLDALLLALNSDSLKLIVRIALVPLVEDSDAWASLRPIVIGDLDPNLLDDLKLGNVLANDLEPPGFGHPTRREAARSLARVRTYLQKPGAPVDIFAERRNVTHPLRLRRET